MAEQKVSPFKIVLGKHRISYQHLDKPSSFKDDNGQDGAPKYDVTFLIAKDHPDVERIQEVFKKVYAANKESQFKGTPITSKNLWNPLRDGDDWLEEHPEASEYEGHYFIKASSTSKPKVFDADRNEIIDIAEEVYSGCYCRGVINGWAFNKKGNKGVGFFLNSVQKISDGERLGGFVANPDDYDDDYSDDDLG